ncbi:MAG: helix-turn-helix domain-containing protein [Dorea sp.]|nr:helix-turn-helix domain-containing protein [Dorea sp.]
MTIGERLKEVRESLSDGKTVSMAKFAEVLQVSPATINQWEKGKREIPKPMITLICQKYDINETWLLTGEGEMHEPPSRQQEIAQLVAKLAKLNMDDPSDQLLYDIEMWLSKLPKSVWDEFLTFIKEEIPKLNLKEY